jgi:hypothetical protein
LTKKRTKAVWERLQTFRKNKNTIPEDTESTEASERFQTILWEQEWKSKTQWVQGNDWYQKCTMLHLFSKKITNLSYVNN